jgi:hypothetical protein
MSKVWIVFFNPNHGISLCFYIVYNRGGRFWSQLAKPRNSSFVFFNPGSKPGGFQIKRFNPGSEPLACPYVVRELYFLLRVIS